MSEYALHPNPIWGDRANFIIHAKISDTAQHVWEQLWCRQVDTDRFELCCIPVFAYDLSLGDEVVTAPLDGKRYVVQRVVKSSGRIPFRVWFGDSQVPGARQTAPDTLVRLGALVEWYSNNLLAVDTTDETAQLVADYLHAQEQLGALIYETGRSNSRS